MVRNVRKRFAVVVVLACLATTPLAADRERGSRETRTPGEAFFARLIHAIKKVVANSDGISIPKP